MEEEVDDIEIDIYSGKDVLVWADLELVMTTHENLHIVNDVEREEGCSSSCNGQVDHWGPEDDRRFQGFSIQEDALSIAS